MSLALDAAVDLTAARTVRLGGRDFTVAPLLLRQILAIADHVPKLAGISSATLSGETLAPLVDVIWQGLRRAHPNLARDELLDLPITIPELVAAFPVVVEQAGGRKEPAAGES